MIKYLLAIGAIVIFAPLLHAFRDNAGTIISYGECESQFNDTGRCVHIVNCDYLNNMLQNPNDAEKKLLKDSQCGYDNTVANFRDRILVCCPEKYCKDPDPNAASIVTAGNVLPQAGVCGSYLEDKIIGGKTTDLDEFPWMALINYKKPNNAYGFHCGGTLITTRYVLTAGHCIKNPRLNETWIVYAVRLGEWDTTTNPDCEIDALNRTHCAPPHIDINIEKIVLHEDYQPASVNQYDDIALLRLAESVVYTRYVKPICLPASPELIKDVFDGAWLDVAGWGATDQTNTSSSIKMKAVLPVWKIVDCTKPYRNFKITVDGSRQLCAGGESQKDTCGGDSGGPLMVAEQLGTQTIYFIAGIVSFGPTPCALRGWPGVYTRVGSYMPWIRANMEA